MPSKTFDDIHLEIAGSSVVLSQERFLGRVSFFVDGKKRRVFPARRQSPGVWVYPLGTVRDREVTLESSKPRFRSSAWRVFVARVTLGRLGGYVWTWRTYVDGEVAAERQIQKP